ncbi:MAG: cyclic nucleotide-binding domain-containing protein [Thermoanaerobaculia bacterium]
MSTPGVTGVPAEGGAGAGDRVAESAGLELILGEKTLAINWFRGGKRQQEPQEHTIDDLFILERYDEAGERLRARLKDNPNDLHSHLKLAEVYTQLRQAEKAVDEYVYVAEEYAQDGFHDKGIALLAKAMKLAPLDPSLRFKAEKLQRGKSMEQVRELALEGLQKAGGVTGGTTALELKRLWHNLAGSPVVQKLPGESLKRLFGAMALLHLETDVPIVHEGSPDPFLLLIVQGVIEASMKAGGRATPVRSFSAGDVIGEGTLLERLPWQADYRTAEQVIALKLTREGLESCLLGNPDPRGFLETLREQHNDRDVAATVGRLRSGS